MSPTVIDISRLLSGNKAVNRKLFRVGLFQRGDLFVNLESAGAQAGGQLTVSLGARRGSKTHEAIDDPGRAVAVLAAVLTHAGRIVRDSSSSTRFARSIPFRPPSIAASARSSSQAPEYAAQPLAMALRAPISCPSSAKSSA